MALRKLQRAADGFLCPNCGGKLEFSDGGAVAIVRGRLDMANYKPRYICHTCDVFFREVMSTDYYDVFPLDELPEPTESEKETPPAPSHASTPVSLPTDASGKRHCPRCGKELREVEGGSIRVVDGKVDMENTKPKFECDSCGVFYREMLRTGVYLSHVQTEEKGMSASFNHKETVSRKKLVATGDLRPMKLKRDANAQCECPRCGQMMRYVEGEAVRLVDGKPYMDDVLDHFVCDHCASVFRRIVNTEYFQWFEK